MRKILLIQFTILIIQFNFAQFSTNYLLAQNNEINIIATAVPFLSINPNSQTRGFGEIGVVSSPLYYESGLTQNPALLSRNEKISGIKLSYSPWLRNLKNDVYLADIGLFYSINNKNAIGYSFNYFTLGSITITDITGNPISTHYPYAYYHSFRYGRTLLKNLSLGIGIKYFVSGLSSVIYYYGYQKVKSIAGDFGIDYRNTIEFSEKRSLRYDIGLSILNIGPKVSYNDSANGDFIPITMKIGAMCTYEKKLNESYCLYFDIGYQAEKLLVPTPFTSGQVPNNVSVVQGMLQSFSDAPGGATEEWHEIIHQFGFESRLVVNKDYIFASRSGIFYEHYTKGNRKYMTLGLGIGYKFIYLDLAEIYTINRNIALNRTWNVNIGIRTSLPENIFNFKNKNNK